MVGWHRHLQSIIRQAGKKLEHSCNAPTNFSTCHSKSSLIQGELLQLKGLWSLPSGNVSRPLYRYFQQLGFSSTRKLFADSSDATPIPSPLTPTLTISSGQTEAQKAASKPATVQAVLKNIKQLIHAIFNAISIMGDPEIASLYFDTGARLRTFDTPYPTIRGSLCGTRSPKKVNLVAALVRGMRVEDALLQLQVTVKRASKTVYQVIHSARANATHNHGLDADRLLVAEAFVGKGDFKKRISYHAKGKCGIRVRPECRLTVVVRELTPEEEAKIAKLRVSNYIKLTKREKRLVPHQLIETTPIWNRKAKSRTHEASNMDA